MKLEEIQSLWAQDSVIDITKLSEESLKIPSYHSKYSKLLATERMVLRKYESDAKELKLQKYEFLTQGPSEETKAKGWVFPTKALILKSDIPLYLDSDKDIINLNLRINLQQEKVELLTSILKSLNNRNWEIRNSIEFMKFMNGS